MNFTKAYIKECNCKEIQNLSPISTGDWIMFRGGCIPVLFSGDYNIDYNKRSTIIWLPTGYQLDDEIVKICRDKEFSYRVEYYPDEDKCNAVLLNSNDFVDLDYFKESANPLIAKIKLLKALLKEDK